MNIQNHTFLISGGGSGLGKATAQFLSSQGATVIIADINEGVGVQTASEIGASAHFVHTDVTDETSVQNAIDVALTNHDVLHGAINCAGIGAAERTLNKRGVHSSTLHINKLITQSRKQMFDLSGRD